MANTLTIISLITSLAFVIFVVTLNIEFLFATKGSDNTEPGKDDFFLFYENQEVGISVQHPNTWDVAEMCCKGSYGYTNFFPKGIEQKEEQEKVLLRLEYIGINPSVTLDQLVPGLEDPITTGEKGDDFQLIESKPFTPISEKLQKQGWQVLYSHNPLEAREAEDYDPTSAVAPSAAGEDRSIYYQQEGTPVEYVMKVLFVDQGIKSTFKYSSTSQKAFDKYMYVVEDIIDSFRLISSTSIPAAEKFSSESTPAANSHQDGRTSSVAYIHSALPTKSQEYQNDMMFLTLRYPSNWTIEESDGRVKFTSPLEDDISSSSNSNSNSFKPQSPYFEVVTYPSLSSNPATAGIDNDQKALETFANQTIDLQRQSNRDLTVLSNGTDINWSKGTFVKGITFTYTYGPHQYKALQIYQWQPYGIDDNYVYVTTINAPLSEYDRIVGEVADSLYESNSMNFRIMTPEIQKMENERLEGLLDECDFPTSQDPGWVERCAGKE